MTIAKLYDIRNYARQPLRKHRQHATDDPILDRYVFQCAKEMQVSVKVILGPSRRAPIARARRWYWWMARRNGHSVCAIARAFNRDHTTVVHGITKAQAEWGGK